MDLVERKMSVEVHRLIAEVHKRPPLWDTGHGFHRARHCVPKLWREVAQSVGIDVTQCKRKWKNLRDAYRAELKRAERRVEKDKLMGIYDPNTNYNSKWVYFSSLGFLSKGNQNYMCSVENENANSSSNGTNNFDEACFNDNVNNDNFHKNIKLDSSLDMDDRLNVLDDDDDTANDLLFEEFQTIATPQAARRLSATLSMNNPLEQNSAAEQVYAKPSNSKDYSCKCPKRSDEQVHFLEDLGREEQKLINSTRQDITRSNKIDHIGDSDYNFLVSFLPNMKKMTELQNLQFRAKMCDMVLNILAPAVTGNGPNTEARTDEFSNQQAVREGEAMNMICSTSSNNLN